MATIALTKQTTSRSGLADPAGQAVGAADIATVALEDGVFFRVVWGGVGGTLTVVTPMTVGANPSHTVQDDAISFSASNVKWLGPYPPTIYADASGLITLDPDQSCTVTAFKLGSLD